MLKGRDDIMSPLLKHLVRVLSFRVSLLLLSFFKFVREYLGVLAQRRVQDINKEVLKEEVDLIVTEH